MSNPAMVTRPSRASIPTEQTWDLEGLYPDLAAWEADLARVDALLAELAPCRGHLGDGPAALLACLRLHDRLSQVARHVNWYATNRLSEDQADPDRQALQGRATAMVARVNAATAFMEPELLALPPGTIESFLDADAELAVYRLFLTDILDEREHMLGAEAEEAIAAMTELFVAPYDFWRNATTADMPFEPVADEQGRLVPMSLAALNSLLQSSDRRVRQDAYESANNAFVPYRRSLTAAFAAAQKRDVILARLRRYPSALAASLASVHLPETLFHTLVAVAEAGAEPFRRYMRFRGQALGLDRLMPYDLQAPLDADLDLGISFPAACDLVATALAPLGPEYGGVLETAFRDRWVDWADNAGKRAGAYSSACYGYHPVILLNWRGKISDVFTLAHELGHAAHSTFSTRSQPFIYSHYTLFLAEMASTTNELLLARHLLSTTADRPLRRYVLSRALGSFIANFYGGAMLAALQFAVHGMVEEGRPLTYESITEANTGILARWYGDTVEITPEGMGSHWLRPPHHFMNFYSYQYATGIAVAAAFSDSILHDGPPAVERYLGFLRAGSSAHSIDILAAAGVDMTTPAPIERAVTVFDELERELEAL